jgi:hypothetical protein
VETPEGEADLRGTDSTERFMWSILSWRGGCKLCSRDVELAWGNDPNGSTEAGGGTKAIGITFVDCEPVEVVWMEWLSPKGFEWVEDGVGELGTRLIVAFEFAYTIMTESLGIVLTGGRVTPILSEGSGRLRTVSAGAGMSLTSFTDVWRAVAFRRRRQRKRPTERARSTMEPTTAPATTPALVWPESTEVAWFWHTEELHWEQLLKVDIKTRVEDIKSGHVLRNLNTDLRDSTVTNGGNTWALNTTISSYEMIQTHGNHGEKKERGQEVTVQMERALWYPVESNDKMTGREIVVEPGKKEGIRWDGIPGEEWELLYSQLIKDYVTILLRWAPSTTEFALLNVTVYHANNFPIRASHHSVLVTIVVSVVPPVKPM